MLPRIRRLHTDADIARVMKRGRSVWGSVVGVRGVLNGMNVTRWTVVVSTKVSKRAVERNLLKRRLREIIRWVMSQVQPGFDIMVLTKSAAKELSFDQLREEMVGVLRKAKVL